MAAYNFPNSPSDGDTVTSNGITYTYSSSKTRWDGAAPSGSSTTVYATIDLLPLSGASTGDQAYVSGNNRLYIWNGTGWYNIALINTTPSISGANASYALATDGTATTVTITATDPEGLPITYSIASDTSGNVATVTQGTGANTNVFTITPSTNTANAGTFSLTFRASDGVNIATAVSEFTLLFSIENSNYTTTLITSVGANNAVNNSFDDASTNNHTITAYGDATQNTFSPYRHGGYSTYFDGSSDYLATSAIVLSNSTAFTIEMWYYNTSSGTGEEALICQRNPNSPYNGWRIYNNSGATDQLRFYNGTAWVTIASNLAKNQWHHIAVVSQGSGTDQGQCYLNGVAAGSAFTTSSSINHSANLHIGTDNAVTSRTIAGYLRDVRVVNGTAIYTGNFDVPTEPLTAVTNTSLLTCHLPYIADGSTNAHSITVNGDTKTEPFSPYDHNGYSSGSNGASIYFDGTGDYLEASLSTDFNVGTDSFTIECWYKPNAIGDFHPIFNVGDPGNNGYSMDVGNSGNGNSLRFICHIGGSWSNIITGSTALTVGQWYHLAVVRNGNDFDIYLNGKSDATTVTNSGTITNPATDPVRICWYDNSPTWSRYANGIVSDLRFVNGTAVYTADFTPPTAPLTAITNTSFLLNGTDAGIIDKSQSVETLTLNGDVKSSTAQSKYLTSSMYFDGTGDLIELNNSISNWGSADFTIETWIYPTVVGTRHIFGDFNNQGQNTSSTLVAKFDNGVLKWWIQTTTYNSITGTASLSTNAWTHIALVRNGSTITSYVNGTSDGTFNVGTASINTPSIVYTIGTGGDYRADHFQGYMSDFRFTKGLARYTSNFTPPSAALQG